LFLDSPEQPSLDHHLSPLGPFIGSGTVIYAVAPYGDQSPRIGTMTIAGKTFTV
jgi:hypothetical protein